MPLQPVSVIPNKVDKDGNHYLKVLLLSNKKTKNNWIAPYKNIGELPQSLIDSYKNLPFIYKHDHELYDKLDNILKSSGLNRDERHNKLLAECSKIKGGYIDHVFNENPKDTALYGQLKIIDKEENDYIKAHGGKETRIKFTSPAMSGTYEEDDTGLKTYILDTMKAFHLARVPVPAFDEDEAMVKGICANGNSESCREALAYAGIDSPTENVNNSCGCNKNIQEMTNQDNSIPTVGDKDIPLGNANEGAQKFDNQPKVKYTIEPKVTDEPEKIVEKTLSRTDKPEVLKSQAEIDAENERKNDKDTIKKLEKQNREQYEYYLEEILENNIPQDNFSDEKEYAGEKDNLKAFIIKYGVSLQDAKWFIKKSVPKVVEKEVEPQKGKKGEQKQYAGYFNNTYNADLVVKPPTKSGSEESNKKNDKDYPVRF